MKGIILAGGKWYSIVSNYQGSFKADSTSLRQTNDLLSIELSHVGWNSRCFNYFNIT